MPNQNGRENPDERRAGGFQSHQTIDESERRSLRDDSDRLDRDEDRQLTDRQMTDRPWREEWRSDRGQGQSGAFAGRQSDDRSMDPSQRYQSWRSAQFADRDDERFTGRGSYGDPYERGQRSYGRGYGYDDGDRGAMTGTSAVSGSMTGSGYFRSGSGGAMSGERGGQMHGYNQYGQSYGQPSYGERQMGERQMGERQMGERQMGERQIGERQMGERQMGERQMGERQMGERQMGERQMGERQMEGQMGYAQQGQQGYYGQGYYGQQGDRQMSASQGYGQGERQTMGYRQGYGVERQFTGYGQPGGMGQLGGMQPRGIHHGKGPIGYQRSDERIREMVCDALTDDDQIDASTIEVTVKNGEVILSGTVEDRRIKRMAEDVVERVAGVKDVHNQIRAGGERRGTGNGREASGKQEIEVKHRA